MTRARAFARCERAATALESAIALGVLVVAFAGLMHLVTDVYAEDRGARAARAVARVMAIDPSADPWEFLGRELGLDESHICTKPSGNAPSDCRCTELSGNTPGACDGWALSVAFGVIPSSLESALGGTAGSGGDMVLVRLWKGQDTNTPPDAIGLARGEPEA